MGSEIENAPLTIGLVRVNNVMGIRAVTLKTEGDGVVIVTGANAQGKSSLLMAIVMALGGKRAMVEEALRRGEKKGEIVVEVGQYRIRRTLTKKGSYLTITVDGEEINAPQVLLDRLCGEFFEPMSWLAQPPKKQVELLQKISGLDFTALDQEHAAVYQERRDVNRDVKRLKAKAAAMPVSGQTERVDTEKLAAELDRVNETNLENNARRFEAKVAADTLASAQERHARLKQQLVEAEREMKQAYESDAVAKAALIGLEDADESAIIQQIRDAGEINRQVDANEQAAAALEEAEDAANKSLSLTQRLADIEEEKADKLAKSNLPVAGLSFTEDGVTYQGLPFSQASQAQRIKIACALAFADGKPLRVIFVRDASLLDRESLAMMETIAAHYGAQIFMEIVDSKDPAAIRIEDGLVV